MATIATAEVQVIADTSRFVPDLRRKLRAALTGIGADVGDQITNAMRGLGDQISATIEREVRRTTPRVERTIRNLGREAATGFNDSFKDSVTRSGDYDRFFAQLFHGTIAEALEEEAQAAVRAFEQEFDIEQAAVRKAIAAADAMDRAFEERFARNFSRYEDIFESEFDLEQAAFNKAVAAADAMDEAFEQRFALNFERRGEEAAQALADGISSQQGTVNNAFADLLDGIDARQRQAELRARQNGGNIALAFSQGVQRGAQQAADDAADALANSFQNSFRNRLQLVFSRVLDLDDLFDSSRPAIQRATDVLRRFGDTLANVARQITIVPLQNLGSLFSDLTTNMASAGAMALFFLGALDQLAPLLFALPASLALLTAGAATAIVAFQGMGEAFGAAGASAEDFEDAIDGLAPSAQNVAREFRALNDDFEQLRLAAQEALWSRLQGTITEVADNLMGPLQEGLTLAAGALGDLIAGIGDFLAESETADTVAAVFESMAGIFQSLSDEIQPFLGGLRTLVNEFLPGLEAIEDAIDGIGTRFSDWADEVTSGDLLSGISPAQRAFQEALQVMEQLWRITRNVASAVGSVFDAARRNGSGFLDLIEEITENIAEAFATPEGQDTLMGFLDDLVSIAGVVAGVLGTVFEQFPKIAEPLADIAENIGPDLMDFIDELGDAFAVFLEEAGPGFEELASALGELDLQDIANNIGDAFSNVAPFLHEMIELFGDVAEFISIIARTLSFIPRAITAFARGFVFLQEVFDNIRNIDGILSGIGDFFAEFGPRVADGFSDAMDSAGEFLTEFGPRVKDGFEDFLEDVGEFFSEFGDRVADGFGDAVDRAVEIAQQIGDGFMEIFGPIGEGIASVASAIGTFFTETLPNWGIQAIAFITDLALDIYNGLVGIATDIIEWASGLLEQWTTFWTDLKDSAFLTLETIGLDISGSLDGVRSSFTGFTSGISEGWNRFWNNVKTTAQNALNTARSFITNILSSIRSTISGWIDGVRSRWNGFWNGLSGIVSSGLSTARSAVNTALNGIRDAFNNLSDRVRSILNGLRDFISGIFSRIQGIVDNIAGAISSAVSAAQNLGNIDLNPFANGGIVYGPTPALVGEAGPEVIIPLTRPQRAVDLVQQSGLLGLLASQGLIGAPSTSTGPGGPSVEMHVHSGVADPEQIARRAVRIIERRLGGRGLERLAT